MRHNEIQDVTATLLCEVTLYVEVEPTLQPVTGERMNRQSAKVDDNYQLHMKCRGFWSSSQDAFYEAAILFVRLIHGQKLSSQKRSLKHRIVKA